MARAFKNGEREALQALVSDCINYGFTENESLKYIKARFNRDISERTYYKIKKNIEEGDYANEWLNYYTRVGFLVKHKQIMEFVEQLQRDIQKEYFIATNEKVQNKYNIRQLRYELRDNAKLLQDLALGTPVIAQIKAKLDKLEIDNAKLLQSSQ